MHDPARCIGTPHNKHSGFSLNEQRTEDNEGPQASEDINTPNRRYEKTDNPRTVHQPTNPRHHLLPSPTTPQPGVSRPTSVRLARQRGLRPAHQRSHHRHTGTRAQRTGQSDCNADQASTGGGHPRVDPAKKPPTHNPPQHTPPPHHTTARPQTPKTNHHKLAHHNPTQTPKTTPPPAQTPKAHPQPHP